MKNIESMYEAMYNVLQDIYALSLPEVAQNVERPIGFTAIRKKHGLPSTYQYTIHVLIDMKLIQPINNGFLWNLQKSAPTMPMAKLVCEKSKKMLYDKISNKYSKTEDISKISKAVTKSEKITLSDKELVAELRKRGYVVLCYREVL